MMHFRSPLAAFCTCAFSAIVLYGASFFKVTMIVGSMSAFFSGSAFALPMLGYYMGTAFSGGAFVVKLLATSWLRGIPSIHFLAYHIPGFFASASLNHAHWLIRCVIPAVCMILFVIHPVGGAAFAYSLYWLIPIALYFSRKTAFFYHALASTFVAHAVGSVIWLYTMPMTAAVWYGLIPVVAVERLLFACGMTAFVYVVEASKVLWRTRMEKRSQLILTK